MDETSTELATIEGAMADSASEYWQGPRMDNGETAMAHRYRELLEARETKAPPPARTAPDLLRLFELRHMMKDRQGAYWRDESLRQEYLHLLEGRSATPSAGQSNASQESSGMWESQAGKAILADWHRNGGIEANWRAANLVAEDLVAGLPTGTKSVFMAGVSGLPEGARAAMLAELANPYTPRATATGREVERFASTREGAVLVREWGERTPRCLSAVRTRIARTLERMSAQEAASFVRWVDRLGSDEYNAVMRHLASSG